MNDGVQNINKKGLDDQLKVGSPNDWVSEIYIFDVGPGDASIIELWKKEKTETKNYFDNERHERNINTDNLDDQHYKEYAQSPNGTYEAILIDGGKRAGTIYGFSFDDDAEKLTKEEDKVFNAYRILNLLELHNIKLTKTLITHPDSDHYAGQLTTFKILNHTVFWKHFLNTLRFIRQREDDFLEVVNNTLDNETNRLKIDALLYANCIDANDPTFDLIVLETEYLDGQMDSYTDQGTIETIKKNLNAIVANTASTNKIARFFALQAGAISHLLEDDFNSTTFEYFYTKKGELKKPDDAPKDKKPTNLFNLVFTENSDFTKFINSYIGKIIYLSIAIDGKATCYDHLNTTLHCTRHLIEHFSANYVTDLVYGRFNIGNAHIRGINRVIIVLEDNSLGNDIFKFNTAKLQKKATQESETPGLFYVAGGQSHYDFGQPLPGITKSNAASIGLLLVHGNKTYLTCGDLEDGPVDGRSEDTDLEIKLAKTLKKHGYNNLTAMKAGHHGGRNATSNYVLQALNPKNIIICCGGTNLHGHPTVETLSRLYKHAYDKSSLDRIFLTNSYVRYGLIDSLKPAKALEQGILFVTDTTAPDLDEHGQEQIDADGKIKTKVIYTKKQNSEFYEDILEEYRSNYFSVFVNSENKDNFKYPIIYKNGKIKRLKHVDFTQWKKDFSFNDVKGSSSVCIFEKLSTDEYKIVTTPTNKLGEKIATFRDITSIIGPFNEHPYTVKLNIKPLGRQGSTAQELMHLKFTANSSAMTIPTGSGKGKKTTIDVNKKLKRPEELHQYYSLESNQVDPFLISILLTSTPDEILSKYYSVEHKALNYDSKNSDILWDWEIDDVENLYLKIEKFEYSNNKKEDTFFEANIVINGGDTFIKVIGRIRLNDFEPSWLIRLDDNSKGAKSEKLSLSDVLMLSGYGAEITSHIPPALNKRMKEGVLKVEDLEINHFKRHDFPSKTYIDFGLDIDWTVFNSIEISNVGFQLDFEFDRFSLGLYGKISLTKPEIELDISAVFSSSSEMLFEVDFARADGEGVDLITGLEGIASKFIPNFEKVNLKFVKGDSFKIDALQFCYDFHKKELLNLAILSKIQVSIFQFSVKFVVHPHFEMSGHLINAVQLSDFTKQHNDGKNKLEIPFLDSGLVISNAGFIANPSQHFYGISLSLGDVGKMSFGTHKVELSQIIFQLHSNNSSISFSVNAEILIRKSTKISCTLPYKEECIFELEASYDSGVWFFSGDLTGDIELSGLVDELGNKFGKLKLPSWANDWHLKHAGISFRTCDNSELTFDIDIYKGDSELCLSIDKKTDTWDINASMMVGNSEFELKSHMADAASSLKLGWEAKPEEGSTEIPDSAYLSMLDIASHFGISTSDIPSSFDVQFKSATLEYDHGSLDRLTNGNTALRADNKKSSTTIYLHAKTRSGAEMQFFRIADQDGDTKDSIYFSEAKLGTKISLSDLPLIGNEIDKISEISIDHLKAEFASTQITEKEGKEEKGEVNPSIKKRLIKEITQKRGGITAPTVTHIDDKLAVSAELIVGSKHKPLHINVLKFSPKSVQSSLQAEDDAPAKKDSNVTWFKIQKAVGPVGFEKIGVKYANNKLWFLLSASLSIGGLKLDMLGLGLGVRLSDIKDGTFKPSFSLNGMELSYHSPQLSLGGGFLKEPDKKDVDFAYAGSLLLSTSSFSMNLVGEYSQLKGGHPSLFVFGKMQGNFGGSPAFTLETIGAGLGYNSLLTLPDVEKVNSYPLIQALKSENDLKLEDLKGFIKNKIGADWIALGMGFNSYRLIDGELLLMAKLDKHIEAYLLGMASAKFPREGKHPFLNIDLLLKATFKPHEGFLGVDMRLAEKSFVIDPDCHLTGGMAVYLWFGNNKHSGDFVLTVGGYHPSFKKPAHFPDVPRLGFTWKISKHLHMSGKAYFAMTPRELMAGYSICASYHNSWLKGTFHNHLDVLVQYSPFAYAARAGAKLTFKATHWHMKLKGSVSADIHLWGQPTGGIIKFSVCGISFHVHFGEKRTKQKLEHFYKQGETDFISLLADPEELKNESDNLLSLTATKGLVTDGAVKEQSNSNSATAKKWVVQPDSFEMLLSSKIPLTAVNILIDDKPVNIPIDPDASKAFCLANLKDGENTEVEIKVYINHDGPSEVSSIKDWDCKVEYENLPTALWRNDSKTKNRTEKRATRLRINPIPGDDQIKRHAHELDTSDNIAQGAIDFPNFK